MSFIQTYSGKVFDFMNIRNNEIDINDIAHSLANQCRFNGHTMTFYSVARHSVVMATILLEQNKPSLALTALLHDATEAYVGDMVKPLKNLIPQFDFIENEIWLLIAEKYSLPMKLPQEIKTLDLSMLKLEREVLLKPHPAKWDVLDGVPDISGDLTDHSLISIPDEDRRDFLMMFKHLKNILSASNKLKAYIDE